MGEKFSPSFRSDFEVTPKGIHIFLVEEPDVNLEPKDKENVKVFTARAVVQGGEGDGTACFVNFPLVGTGKGKDVRVRGVMNMTGLMIKAKALNAPKTVKNEKGEDVPGQFDTEQFATPKFDELWKMKMPGKMFGGRVEHSKGERGTFANIREFYTVEEAVELIKKQKAPVDLSGKQEEKKAAPADDMFAEVS
jgi:hypothetical protein